MNNTEWISGRNPEVLCPVEYTYMDDNEEYITRGYYAPVPNPVFVCLNGNKTNPDNVISWRILKENDRY